MAPDWTIESATSDDIEAITELWVRLARSQRAHNSYVQADANRDAMRETLAAHQVNDGLLVARIGGNIVGFASFALERGTLALDATRGTLSNLYVEPAYRGQGIGGDLLDAAGDALIGRGANVLVLEVMADNEDARRFYRNQGFEPFRMTMERSLDGRSENDTHSKEDG